MARGVRRMALWCVVLCWTTPALGQAGVPAPSGQLLGAMLQDYPYLLTTETRPEADELNLRIREADTAFRRAESEDARRQAQADREAAETDLAAFLAGLPNRVDVALAEGGPTLDPPGPWTLPGDSGALLLRLGTPGDVPQFALVRANLSERDGDIEIPAFADGGWALLGLDRVPLGETVLRLAFAGADGGPRRALVRVVTPDSGRLRLSFLDEAGRSEPVMLRLFWKTGGQERRPSNGIDFAPQFDRQGGARVANLPGRLRGTYWCVPDALDMAVPPGEWEVVVRRGPEHMPVFDTFAVASGETVELTYSVRRWVDMPRRGWWSGDDHVHGQILSDDDAARLMAWTRAEDVHLSNIVKMGDIHRTWFEQRGFGKEFRVAQGDYVLSPGQECPRTHAELGHTLAMNITRMVRDTDRYYLYDLVFDEVHAQGGLTGYAHVGWEGFDVHRDMSINVPKNKVDFVELLQFTTLGTEVYYDFLNTGFKITASAGSDVPWGGTIGEVRLYAFLGDQPFDADRWFEAVRRGHTFVTNGPMLEFTVNDALPGDEVRVDDDRPLRVRARVWGQPGLRVPTRLEVVRHGDVVQSAESSDPAQGELSLDVEVDPGQGCWIAARAETDDGARAHTTPVYVVRDPLRFWKYEELPTLIAKRVASLEEVRALIDDYRARDARGELATDRARRVFVENADALIERLDAARRIYDDLLEAAEAERPLRARR